MVADPISTIIAKLEGDYQRLLETVASIPEAQFTISSGDGKWSARDILTHLANAERDHRRVAQAIIEDTPVELPNFDLDRWNEAGVARRAGQDLRTILDDLEAEHRETIAFATRLAVEDLEKQGHHPALGEITVGKLLRVVGLHQRMHQRDIVALVGANRDV